MKKTYTTIKNEIRATATEMLETALREMYSEAVVGKSGTSEIVLDFGEDDETGNRRYVTFAPTVKEFRDRKTTAKSFKAFDGKQAVSEYAESLEKKAREAEEKRKAKEEKIAADKALREKKRAEKEAE